MQCHQVRVVEETVFLHRSFTLPVGVCCRRTHPWCCGCLHRRRSCIPSERIRRLCRSFQKDTSTMANHGPSYGLSRELERKNQARFCIEEAQEVLLWIEEVTGVRLGEDPAQYQTAEEVSEALKDGVVLAKLIHKLQNKAVGVLYRVHENPRMPFHKMENISNFLGAIKAYGVSEISCFQTVDLYENKQCYKVIECLRALAAVAQTKEAPVPFPHWVVKMSTGQKRHFSNSQIRGGDAVIPLQYGTNKCASQKGMTPYGLARQIKPDPLFN